MKINWHPMKGALVSIPDRMLSPTKRKYAIVTQVSITGDLLEVLADSLFVLIRKEQVFPIIDTEGRWIQLGG